MVEKKTTKTKTKKTGTKTEKKKTPEKKPAVKKAVPKKKDTKEKAYFEAVGRRKRSVARIRLWTSPPQESVKESGEGFLVNEKNYKDYFSTLDLQNTAEAALRRLKSLNRFKVSAKVSGGGIRGQADAIKHGLARALVKFDFNFRKKLKKSGFLTRDPRKKERKKYGLKKARRAPQWQKR